MTNSVTLNNMIESNGCNVDVGMADGIPEDRTYIKDLLGTRQAHPDCEQRVLEVRWNFVQDELIFDLNGLAILVKRTLPTKRQIVAITTLIEVTVQFIMKTFVVCRRYPSISKFVQAIQTACMEAIRT